GQLRALQRPGEVGGAGVGERDVHDDRAEQGGGGGHASGLRVGRGRVDGDVAAAHHRAGGRLPAPVVEALEGEQRAVGGLVVGVVHAALGAQAGGALGAVGGAAALGQPVGDAVQLDGAAVRGQLQVGAAGPQR